QGLTKDPGASSKDTGGLRALPVSGASTGATRGLARVPGCRQHTTLHQHAHHTHTHAHTPHTMHNDVQHAHTRRRVELYDKPKTNQQHTTKQTQSKSLARRINLLVVWRSCEHFTSSWFASIA